MKVPVSKILRVTVEVEVRASDEEAIEKAEEEVKRMLRIDRGTVYKGGEYAVRSTGICAVERVDAPKKAKGRR